MSLMSLSRSAGTGAVSLQRDRERVVFFFKIYYYYMSMADLHACIFVCSAPRSLLLLRNHLSRPDPGLEKENPWL